MKRLFSCILILAFPVSLCGISGSAINYSDDIETKYDILHALGVMNHRKLDGDYVFVDVSKASFINTVCNMLGDYQFSNEYNEEAIQVAENAGLIHSGQTDLIKPLNYEEAVTILVRLLGFGIHAEAGGGWPMGYISVANKLGLSEGVTASVGQQMRVCRGNLVFRRGYYIRRCFQ